MIQPSTDTPQWSAISETTSSASRPARRLDHSWKQGNLLEIECHDCPINYIPPSDNLATHALEHFLVVGEHANPLRSACNLERRTGVTILDHFVRFPLPAGGIILDDELLSPRSGFHPFGLDDQHHDRQSENGMDGCGLVPELLVFGKLAQGTHRIKQLIPNTIRFLDRFSIIVGQRGWLRTSYSQQWGHRKRATVMQKQMINDCVLANPLFWWWIHTYLFTLILLYSTVLDKNFIRNKFECFAFVLSLACQPSSGQLMMTMTNVKIMNQEKPSRNELLCLHWHKFTQELHKV